MADVGFLETGGGVLLSPRDLLFRVPPSGGPYSREDAVMQDEVMP